MSTVLNYLDVNGTYEAKDYPYGRLRTSAFFKVEFKPKKGFRGVFQTINPKNGKLNAPKNGTYNQLACVKQDLDTGYYYWCSFNIRGYDDINKVSAFITENSKAINLTNEMIQHIAGCMLVSLKVSMSWTKVKEENKEYFWNLMKPFVLCLSDMYKNGSNKFSEIVLPVEIIKSLDTEEIPHTITPVLG